MIIYIKSLKFKCIIREIHSKGAYKSFHFGEDNVYVFILQLEDDTILFCKDDDSMFNKLTHTVDVFLMDIGASSFF